jgi:hypothetical protein
MAALGRLACALAVATAPAAAGDGDLVRGIFCNTEAQLDAAVGLLRRGVAPALAVARLNREAVVCVLATDIAYMIMRPRRLGEGAATLGHPRYAGTLIGVLVGDNPRPVDPPVEMFFLPDAPLASAAAKAHGA